MGNALSTLMILVLTYVAWKIVFYLEAEHYGIQLSRDLAAEVLLDAEDFFTPEYFTEKNLSFEKFDYFPKDIIHQLDPDTLKGHIYCEAKTDIHSFIRYSAAVTCHIDKWDIHYFFSKTYDYSLTLIFSLGLIFPALYGATLFFAYVDRLQNQNLEKEMELTKERLVIEIGARLVHDLKKGVMAQLNHLHQEYGQDLDMAVLQPDFAEHFQSKLQDHFKHIDFLNRYINLLTTNLKREKESYWVLADNSKIMEYLSKVFQVDQFTKSRLEGPGAGVLFIHHPSNKISELRFSDNFQGFLVPEMSFFRILKNISENFNTYGQGAFRLEISLDALLGQVQLRAINPVNPSLAERGESTNLGHTIIRQLLQDNFGAEAGMKIQKNSQEFHVQINFPFLQEGSVAP